MIRVWLTKDDAQQFDVNRYKPIPATITGTARRAWYPVVGEPVGWRHMCGEIVDAILGSPNGLAAMDEPELIYVMGCPVKKMTPKLRAAYREAIGGKGEDDGD